MQIHPLRLAPGQDLMQALDDLVREKDWPAACVITGIGSLRTAAIRFADAKEAEMLEGPFEILSLGGTLSRDGSHLHVLISDGAGGVKGGHLKEGSVIYTTAELVLGILPEWEFARELDSETNCAELKTRRLRQDRS